MEATLDLEDDDLFFADLSKQISLLIMDDDDDDDDQDSLARISSVNLQVLSQRIHPASQASFFNNGQKRESKGTGVFIPRSPHPKRKNARQGKFRSSGNKVERPSTDQNSRGFPHMAYNNSISPSYRWANHRTYDSGCEDICNNDSII